MAAALGTGSQRLSVGHRSTAARPLGLSARPALAQRPGAPSSSGRAPAHICGAGKLDEVSLFADSSMLGPSAASASGTAGGVESVELISKVRRPALGRCSVAYATAAPLLAGRGQ